MTAFETALARVLAHEGGYVNDPKDPGGETKYGISKRAYPDVNIRSLTKAQAGALYRRDYWDAISGDELPPAVAFQVFDAAVNHGVAWASRTLQCAVRVPVDGVIGPQTIAAVENVRAAATIEAFNDYRERYYRKLPTFARFGKGWLARLEGNRAHAVKDLA